MYRVIEQEYVAFVDGVSRMRVTILADTSTDIPEPDESWEVGSMCIVAVDHSFKILNNERGWV